MTTVEGEKVVKTVTHLLEEIPDELNTTLEELHCSNCGRFLALVAIVEGTLVIKCRQCKNYTVLDVQGISVVN